MVFSSPDFLFLFLPVALAICMACPRRAYLAVLYLLSLAFYFWSSGLNVFLLLSTLAITFFSARFIHSRPEGDPARRTALVLAAVALIGELVFFKYLGFAATNVDALMATNLAAKVSGIILPIGISFFTFQALSYLIDVYRGAIPAEQRPLLFNAYLTFFPHLIAGPIVRYRDVVDDFRRPRISLDSFAEGATRFTHGLLKKVLIADGVAPIADSVFTATGSAPTFTAAWLGAVAYTVQIYFDFSAYSDMAIGLARMLGIRFLENFERPYGSRSITEFWRRWHISLSSWFRDYLYIPLGGNRRGPWRTYANLLIVFAVTGLWHGAAWTFLIWGLYHGLFLILERLAFRDPLSAMRRTWLRYAYCLPVVIVGWVLFRAPDIGHALTIWTSMASPASADAFTLGASAVVPLQGLVSLAIGAIIFFLPGPTSFGVMLMQEPRSGGRGAAVVLYMVAVWVLASLLVLGGDHKSFIYFRF